MPTQEHSQSKGNRRDSEDESLDADVALDKTAQTGDSELDSDVDAILGDIDELLEVNAEDFVKSFVQKGGQ